MTQVTREEVQATFNRLLEGAVDRILASFRRQPEANISIEDAIRWELVGIGEAIDIAKLHRHMQQDEFGDGDIAMCGRNREQGYLWVRLEGATENRLPSGLIPVGQYLRKFDDPLNTLCGPGETERPPPADGSMSEVDMLTDDVE